MNRAQRRAEGITNKEERQARHEARRRELLCTLTIACPGIETPCASRTAVPFGALRNGLYLTEALEPHGWTLAFSDGYEEEVEHFTALCSQCSLVAYEDDAGQEFAEE